MSAGGDDLGVLEADLREVAMEAGPNLEKAIEVTARNIKDDWAEGAQVRRGPGFSKRYASSIDYDMLSATVFGQGAIEAEIGPNLRKAGGAAGFLEDAPGGVLSPPQHAGRDALEKNQQDFADGIAKAVIDTLDQHNL